MKITAKTRKSHYWNEDRFVLGKDYFMVIDGATPLIKTNNFSWENIKKHGKDSLKDLYNNYEATVYGLTNPDKDCRIWLKDLDINTNTWRNK